ncbi:MAG TPA: hypothetical protein VLS90_02915, partial [Thermodesulfobacteriota bacterium]|nr:hypothetical protein [Thermodesulfobacteriota bacterium]
MFFIEAANGPSPFKKGGHHYSGRRRFLMLSGGSAYICVNLRPVCVFPYFKHHLFQREAPVDIHDQGGLSLGDEPESLIQPLRGPFSNLSRQFSLKVAVDEVLAAILSEDPHHGEVADPQFPEVENPADLLVILGEPLTGVEDLIGAFARQVRKETDPIQATLEI